MTAPTKSEILSMISRLKNEAEQQAKNRRIAEWGPAGGNPDAKAEDHLEWKAAMLLERCVQTTVENCIKLCEAIALTGPLDQEATCRKIATAIKTMHQS